MSENDQAAEEHQGGHWVFLLALSISCGVFLVLAYILERTEVATRSWVILFYLISMLCGGLDAAVDAWPKLKKGRVDIHFLMLSVAVGASAIGAYAEGALLLFLFSLSGAMEHYAIFRTHREISSLVSQSPQTARLLLKGGQSRTVGVEEVKVGDKVLVRPDELFPLDGRVLSGTTAADESNLTGESTPVEKDKGDTVFSGTLNLWGVAEVKVTKLASQSSLQKIIRLIYEARKQKAQSQRFTENFGSRYTYAVLGMTLLVFLGWWQIMDLQPFLGDQFDPSAFYRAMTFLVVASPCALVLSIPSAILACIAKGARNGILFRGGAPIEKLAEIDCVAMDKTGTLTEGEPQVDHIESFPPGQEAKVLEIAYNLERHSNHPIARAITSYGERKGLRKTTWENFQSVSGKGLRATGQEGRTFLGRRELFQEESLSAILPEAGEPPPSFTEVWIVQEKTMGRILLKDSIREDSPAVLKALRNLGLRTMMLTGDRRSSAEMVAKELGIQEVRSGLLPEDKIQIIRQLAAEGEKVAMVGDGVNDAPSLAQAYVGVGMGARGSDAALEEADIVLMNDHIGKFLDAYLLSRKARKIIRQNLAVAIGTVVTMMMVSILGWIPLSVGVLAHEGSTVLVCLNSLRLLGSYSTVRILHSSSSPKAH